MALVCSSCFDDPDIRSWIREQGGGRGCDFCGGYDSPTCDLDRLCGYITSCLQKYWGFAVDQLPYETGEGGYQGSTWDTYDLLLDEIGIGLPRDRKDRLLYALMAELPSETWCDFDWLRLDEDEALKLGWDRFCSIVKHERRFFFNRIEEDDDSYSPQDVLNSIASLCLDMGLVRALPIGLTAWRARTDLSPRSKYHASDFGPPPPDKSLQSNRMNPPGVPMLYLASTAVGAIHEVKAMSGRVGRWSTLRPLNVLDLRKLPAVPGIFSDATRFERLGARFLRKFAQSIMQPVARDDRAHIDYLPSQVVTEFLRDYKFGEMKLDGIAYGSVVHPPAWNVVLFASNADMGLVKREWYELNAPQWIEFRGGKFVRLDAKPA